MNYKQINGCRVCKNNHLNVVLDLGEQYLSGIFPKNIDLNMHKSPLVLVKCNESFGGCGLVQLQHTFDLSILYGEHYGYRSGLNASMVQHLRSKYERITNFNTLNEGDVVIDIAGNDGTFLGFFSSNLNLTSIDPTSKKFAKYYKPNVKYISDFFSESVYRSSIGEQNAKVVTSFSMFYDLEDPCSFAEQVRNILDPHEGIWVLEQSYMPTMLETNSFDTVCHEHLSYYGMRQIKYIMDTVGLKIIDFEFNDVNGGSISITVANSNSKYAECSDILNSLIQKELEVKLDTTIPWEMFRARIEKCKNDFYEIIKTTNPAKLAGLGASTKGNVTLQTWNIDCVNVIGDVNPDKHGCYTPGTWIPIVDEANALEDYDTFVVFPWHFRNFFVNNPRFRGKKLIFPLPTPEVVEVL